MSDDDDVELMMTIIDVMLLYDINDDGDCVIDGSSSMK